MLSQIGDQMIHAIQKKFGRDAKVNENMISFIKEYVCKNAEVLLNVDIRTETEVTDDPTLYQTRKDRIRIIVTPVRQCDDLEIVFQTRESYEDIYRRQAQSGAARGELAALTGLTGFGRRR
jgi:hypothetical protein